MKMELPFGEKVLLTSAQVSQWRDEYAALSEQRDTIAAKLGKLEEKLNAVALLTGTSMAALLGDAEDEDDGTARESMTVAIRRVLAASERPLTRLDIRTALSLNPDMAERIRRGPNTFYNAMNRLLRRAEIRQEGERFTAA